MGAPFVLAAPKNFDTTPPYDAYITSLSGLVHRWKFKEIGGNFLDSIGSLDLAASGSITYSAGTPPIGGAILFGSGGKGISSGLGSIPVGSSDRSIVLIYQRTANGKQTLFSYGTSGLTRQWFTGFINDATDGQASLAVWADDLLFPSSGCNGAGWHIYIITISGTAGFMEIDSAGNTASRTFGGNLATGSSGNFQIGQNLIGPDQASIYLDDLAIFNRVLSGAEIATLLTKSGL